MKSIRLVLLLAAMLAAFVAPRSADAFTVDLSLNVTPTNLAAPNGGGTWRLVAKTDAPVGIAGISVWLNNITTSILVEPDVNCILTGGGLPYIGTFGGITNVVYGQDISVAPILAGVGRPALSDGPDPFGNPFWDGATRIFRGTYNSTLPSWSSTAGSITSANVLTTTVPNTIGGAVAADVTTVVRVAVPEPSAIAMAIAPVCAFGASLLRRRR